MLTLLLAGLRYRTGMVIHAAVRAIVLAAGLNLILPVVGAAPSPNDDFELIYFFPILLLFSSAFVGFGQLIGDAREVRLARFVLLPRTRAQTGLAWVLTPLVTPYLGLALAQAIMLAIHLARGSPLVGWRFRMLTYLGGILAIVLQWLLLFGELRQLLRASRSARGLVATAALCVALFMSLRALRHYIDLDPHVVAFMESLGRLHPESMTASLLVHALAWLMCAASFVLFMRRKSMLV